MKLIWLKWGAFASIAVLTNAIAGTAALAQDQPSSQSSSSSAASTPAPAQEKEKKEPIVEQRKITQQNRIADGVKSGQLTARETANLEKKEAAINRETDADRAANGGKLTPAEKAQVTRHQNEVSKQIYRDKHNANATHFGNNKVGQRRENQQDRIAQGVKTGQLTPGETAKLEKKQTAINKQVAGDRRANGGTLTAAQKRQINKEQNRTSRNIYRKKHNAAKQDNAKPKP